MLPAYEIIGIVSCELRYVTMQTIAARVVQRANEKVWESYTADMLWSLNRCMYGKDYAVPTYDSIMHPTKGAEQKEEMTAEEIRQRILDRLKG